MNQLVASKARSTDLDAQNTIRVCRGGRIDGFVGSRRSGPYYHDFYDVECCTGGSCTLHVNGRLYQLTAGDLYIVPPHTVYSKQFSPESNFASFVCVKGNSLPRYFGSIGMDAQNVVFPHKLTDRALELLDMTIDSLESHELLHSDGINLTRTVEPVRNASFSDHDGLEAELRITACFSLFLAELMRIYGSNRKTSIRNTSMQSYVESAARFIEENYHRDISVSSVADYVGIDRSYLFSLFRREMGMSVQAYLIRVRMRVACVLLKQPQVPIKDIPAAVGYDSSSFWRTFKKVVGSTPAQYREMRSNE